MPIEVPLAGGNASASVVRVGSTVRKPWNRYSDGVAEYMRILRQRGIDLPEPLGRDAQGRTVTEFVAGLVATDAPRLDAMQLARVGGMVRAIHDASAGLDARDLRLGPALIPVAHADLVSHCDLTPWNLVVGPRWVFIDWDGSAASTRVWDLAYSVQAFTLNDADADPVHAAADLEAFANGYGADAELRAALLEALPKRAWSMHDFLRQSHRERREPWASMYTKLHGAHWSRVARFIERNATVWRSALHSD